MKSQLSTTFGYQTPWNFGLGWGSAQLLGPATDPAPPGSSPAGRCPMTTAVPTTALATIQPAFTDAERLALAGFLAGYRGLTREAYTLDRARSPAGGAPVPVLVRRPP